MRVVSVASSVAAPAVVGAGRLTPFLSRSSLRRVSPVTPATPLKRAAPFAHCTEFSCTTKGFAPMRSLSAAALATLMLPAAAHAQDAPQPARLKADVEKLVSFGTRHTLSDPVGKTRGIGAARRWFAEELTRIGAK